MNLALSRVLLFAINYPKSAAGISSQKRTVVSLRENHLPKASPMRKLVNVLLTVLACCAANSVRAQSTIFTYQGRLSVNGSPANGFYDFVFSIYKIETSGVLIAGPITNSAVAVSGGLFTIPLDFGHQPFLGVNRFLDIGVRPTGTPSDFTSIGPRVRIASAPYAIAAANVIDGAENVKQAAWMNNAPAVILNIRRQPGANIIQVVDRIKALLPQLQANLPSTIQMTLLTDRTETIRASVRTFNSR